MTELDMLKLRSRGYCCSQIMVQLVLDLRGKPDTDLVNFARGLCMGGGLDGGDCGILTAGICILAMVAPGDADKQALVQEAYAAFFRDQVETGTTCREIAGDVYPRVNPDTCGPLLGRCYSRLLAILMENGVDPEDADAG